MAPNPCATRWNSWFYAAIYHKKYYDLYHEFIDEEFKATRMPPPSLEYPEHLLSDSDAESVVKVQIDLIADKCSGLIHLTDLFESSLPNALKVFEALEDTQIHFCVSSVFTVELYMPYFVKAKCDDLLYATKLKVIDQVKEAHEAAREKLEKYLGDGQPGLDFLKQVRIFNPSRLSVMSKGIADYAAIPQFAENVSPEEMELYFTIAAEAVQARAPGIVEAHQFWMENADRLPSLAPLAIVFTSVLISAADVERCNSIYKLILSPRRRSLTEKSLRAHLFLHYNNNNNSRSENNSRKSENTSDSESEGEEMNFED